MKIKRCISLLLCICLSLQIAPYSVFAAEPDIDLPENTYTIGEIGGYLAGNEQLQKQLFLNRKFNCTQGHAFAAEIGNNLIDNYLGHSAQIVGDNNIKDGADRLIINRDGSNLWIQDKYCRTAKASVDEAFKSPDGLYRYFDGDGKPMQLEVPSDQYDDALHIMRKKIKDGHVPGVTDPDDAQKLVRKGHLSYTQAQNLAKAGTVESLVYDAKTGIVSTAYAAGISFVIDFTCCMLNGQAPEDALVNAGMTGLKTGGVIFAAHVITSQLARTNLKHALVPTSEAIAKALGKNVCDAIALKAGSHVVGQTTTQLVSNIIAENLIADGVVCIILTGIDVVDLFRGRISKEELLKNLTVTIVSAASGTAGSIGGFTLGNAIVPGVGGSIGSVVGGCAGGALGALSAEYIIAPSYESDAEEMYRIIKDEFTNLSSEYLINEQEGVHITDSLQAKLDGDTLKDMFESNERNAFAKDLLEPLFLNEVSNRELIAIPAEKELRQHMKMKMQGVAQIH